ncbi:MAG TPA: hypothetical protein VEH06_00755 [Candidatus Bathyarchaeia archaeon]|nr:hypothetical protein [Candidatus Bathyarchaeia archaeon]
MAASYCDQAAIVSQNAVDGTDLGGIFRTLDLSTKISEKWIDLIQ